MNPFLLESFFLLDGEFWVKLNGKEKREKRKEKREKRKEKRRRKEKGEWVKGRRKGREGENGEGEGSGIITLRGNEKCEEKNSKYQWWEGREGKWKG